MPKEKFTIQQKIEITNRYLSGDGSYETLSKAYGVGYTTLKSWVSKYLEHGETAFVRTHGNSSYALHLKRCAFKL